MSEWVKVNNEYKQDKTPEGLDRWLILDVKDRAGKVTHQVPAYEVNWRNSYSSFDIIEYKIIGDPFQIYKDTFREIHDKVNSHDGLVTYAGGYNGQRAVVERVRLDDNGQNLTIFYEAGGNTGTKGTRKDLEWLEQFKNRFQFYKENV